MQDALKNAHTSIQVQPEQPGIPCAMALRLMPCSPRRRIRFASVADELRVRVARSGFGAIPAPDNPHQLIASYAKDMEIVVFNGHIHTTEIYEVDGVKYLMLGGGGAEQDPILPGRSHVKVPANYPPDLYWKGEDRKEEYNYVLVDVEPGQKTKFTLHRFRPWSAKPFETVELWKTSK